MTKSQRNKPYFLDTAKLHWGDDGVHHSESFGDAYFSMESGIDENRHIFLHTTNLQNAGKLWTSKVQENSPSLKLALAAISPRWLAITLRVCRKTSITPHRLKASPSQLA
jgi:hypothetical protein